MKTYLFDISLSKQIEKESMVRTDAIKLDVTMPINFLLNSKKAGKMVVLYHNRYRSCNLIKSFLETYIITAFSTDTTKKPQNMKFPFSLLTSINMHNYHNCLCVFFYIHLLAYVNRYFCYIYKNNFPLLFCSFFYETFFQYV